MWLKLKKYSCTLFAGSNSEFGTTYSYSCYYNSIIEQLVPCKRCSNKSLNGEDSKTCSKCWNLNLNRAKYSKELVLSAGGFAKKSIQNNNGNTKSKIEKNISSSG